MNTLLGEFNRSTQHMRRTVRLVFRSLTFSSVFRLAALQPDPSQLESVAKELCPLENTGVTIGLYSRSNPAATDCSDRREKRGQAYFINYKLCMLALCLDQNVSNSSMPFTTS